MSLDKSFLDPSGLVIHIKESVIHGRESGFKMVNGKRESWEKRTTTPAVDVLLEVPEKYELTPQDVRELVGGITSIAIEGRILQLSRVAKDSIKYSAALNSLFSFGLFQPATVTAARAYFESLDIERKWDRGVS